MYLVFTTNVLRDENKDGSFSFHDYFTYPDQIQRKHCYYNSPYFSNYNFDKKHPAFTYQGKLDNLLFGLNEINKWKINTPENDVALFLNTDTQTIYIYFWNGSAPKYEQKWIYSDIDKTLIYSDITREQIELIKHKLNEFGSALLDNNNPNIDELQEQYLTTL